MARDVIGSAVCHLVRHRRSICEGGLRDMLMWEGG